MAITTDCVIIFYYADLKPMTLWLGTVYLLDLQGVAVSIGFSDMRSNLELALTFALASTTSDAYCF